MPFVFVNAGKNKTGDKLEIHTITKLNSTQKQQTTQNAVEQN